MSDETSDEISEARPTRSVPGLILGGLAAGAILSAPVAAAAAPAGTEAVAAVVSSDRPSTNSAQPAGSSIREQFRTAFTPGALVDRPEVVPIVIMEN